MGSGGGGGGGNPQALMGQNTPMPGLPIAGQGEKLDPYNYGKFQNFLPDIKAEGQNDMATGLRPDMFKYRSPSGEVMDGGGAAGGNDSLAGQIQGLRDQLAKLQSGQGGGSGGYNDPFDQNGIAMQAAADASRMGGGGGGVGTMGLGQGGGVPVGLNMAAIHPEHAQPGVAGFTTFAPWGGGSGPNDPMFRRDAAGGSGQPIDWRAKDAAAAEAAAAALAAAKPAGT